MIKDTNPDHYRVDGADFVEYMHDPKISGFGDWMFANGYNTGTLAERTQWISVKDRMPDKDGKYLCVWQGRSIDTGMFTNGHFRLYGEVKDKLVSHWMPLPKPPEKEEKHEI